MWIKFCFRDMVSATIVALVYHLLAVPSNFASHFRKIYIYVTLPMLSLH